MNKVICRETAQDFKYLNTGVYQSMPYNYSALADRILLSSIPTGIQTTTSAAKILRDASKLLILNVFECSLLHYVLVDDSFHHVQLEDNQAIQQLINFDQFVYGDRKYSSVLLFILLNGYYIKSFVNKGQNMIKVDKNIKRLIPSFSKIYQQWDKKKLLKKVSLQDINEIFITHSFVGAKQEINQNYNEIVDQILQMSKPYSNINKMEVPLEQQYEQSFISKKEKETVSKGKSKKKRKQVQTILEQKPIIQNKQMDQSFRRSYRNMRKLQTPSQSPEDALFFKPSGDRMMASQQMYMSKDMMGNNMLNSVQSIRHWNINNSFFDNDNLLMRSSYRRAVNFEPLLISQPSLQSPKQQTNKVKKPELKRVQSEEQI